MEWDTVVLDWVNCLRLTENPVRCIEELSDGKFICEIIQLLFHKTVDIRNKAQVFQILEENLTGLFTPPDWIDFSEALEGNREEFIKLLSVLVGVGSLQSEEKVFLDNPSNHLTLDGQIKLRNFLEAVLENGKVVDQKFFADQQQHEGGFKNNKPDCIKPMTPRILSPNNRITNDRLPESPRVYSSSPGKENEYSPNISPLRRDFSPSPGLETEMLLVSEKNNEICSLRTRIDVLTACQQDLMDDLSSFKDENSKLSKRIGEMEKENQSLKLKTNLQKSLLGSPKQAETPEKTKNLTFSLKEKLRKAEEYNDQLEENIFDTSIKIKNVESEFNSLEDKLQSAALREKELVVELHIAEEKKAILQQRIEEREDKIKSIQQELEDYKESSVTASDSSQPISCGICGINCDTSLMNTSQSDFKLPGGSEDLGSSVVDIQLREANDQLQEATMQITKLQEQSVDLNQQLQITEGHVLATKVELQETRNALNKLTIENSATKKELQKTQDSLKRLTTENSTTRGTKLEIGSLILGLFISVFVILLVLVLFCWNSGELLMDLPQVAVKYGRLEHINRPII